MNRPLRTRLGAAFLALILCATACSSTTSTAVGEAVGQSDTTVEAVGQTDTTAEAIETHADVDTDYTSDLDDAVAISLDGSTATADSDDVSIEGSTVTITSGGSYTLSGTLTDGAVIVDAGDDDVVVSLNGVDITNTNGSALAIMSADEATVVLGDGTTNSLADGAVYAFPDAETDEPNAALYSAADLTIAGAGALDVTANYNDGVTSKDGLVIVSGTIDVQAVDDGIRGKDYAVIHGGTISVEAQGDGIKSDNEDDIERGYVHIDGGDVSLIAGDDGIQAANEIFVTGGVLTIDAVDDGIKADASVTIDAGEITILRAFEGIESEVITINDGFIDITATDDGLNVTSSEDTQTVDGTDPAQTGRTGRGGGGPGQEVVGEYYIYINGGTTVITILGELDEQGDGIDANGHVEMTGGLVVVNGPTDTRNSAVDYSGGSFVLTGGTFIGTNVDGRNSEGIGAGSTQSSLYVTTGSTLSAGTVVHVQDSDGAGLVTFKPANDYSVIVFTSGELVSGASYDIYLGGEVAGDSATSLYEEGDYTPGELAGSVIANASA